MSLWRITGEDACPTELRDSDFNISPENFKLQSCPPVGSLGSLHMLKTTVVGSWAFPGWLCQAEEAMRAGKFGLSDVEELRHDAVTVAVRDQESAGIDEITDGEMARLDFNLGFYNAFPNLRRLPAGRLLGAPAHDQRDRYAIDGPLDAPHGLGVVEEFRYLKTVAKHAIKIAVP